jgi:hypothetical protein
LEKEAVDRMASSKVALAGFRERQAGPNPSMGIQIKCRYHYTFMNDVLEDQLAV